MANPLQKSTSTTQGAFQPLSKEGKQKQQRLPESAASIAVMSVSSRPMLNQSQASFPPDPVSSALRKGDIALALSEATYMNNHPVRSNKFTKESRDGLESSHASLIHSCMAQQQLAGAGDVFGVPMAMYLINTRLISNDSFKYLQTLKTSLCQEEGECGQETLSADLGNIQILADQAPLEAIDEISRVYRMWRPVLPRTTLNQLAEAYRKVLPAMLTECEQIMVEDPAEAEFYFRSYVVLHLELLACGSSPEECQDVKSKVGAMAYKVFHKNLSLESGRTVLRSSTVEDLLLIKHCANWEVLCPDAVRELNQLIQRKGIERESVKGKSQLNKELIQLLSNGKNQEALRLYCQKAKESPDLLMVASYFELNRHMKRALGGELACLCLQISREGVTLENAQHIQSIIGLLGKWVEMPWITGVKSWATLNALRVLVSERFLVPLWEKAYKARDLEELGRLQRDYEVFIYDDFLEQFESLQLNNESLQLNSESLQLNSESLQLNSESLQRRDESLQRRDESLQRRDESLQRRDESPQQQQIEPEASPDKSSAPHERPAWFEPEEKNLKSLLSSPDKLVQFTQLIHEKGGLEKEGRQWLALMEGMYRQGKFTNLSTRGAVAMKQVICEITALVVRQNSERIHAAPSGNKRQTCKEASGDALKMLLLLDKFDITLPNDDFKTLMGLVRSHYLNPFLSEVETLKAQPGKKELWDAMTELYNVTGLLLRKERRRARKAYIQLYPVNKFRITRDLRTGDQQTIIDTLKHIQAIILERNNFYGAKDVKRACLDAEIVVCVSVRRLNELVKQNSETWLPVKMEFLDKCRNAEYFKQLADK